ncbi:MAG: apolipoprotein N-acyltransferase [Acidobacteria bacterium]|nr:apolipoprotein N-acyltransferase [Acidobacteriota bacterium]
MSLKSSFLYGALGGAAFFYGSSYWVTYSMIHYGGLPPWLAYGLTVIPAVALGVFWGPFALGVRWAVTRLGVVGVLMAPPLWALAEWGRYLITGMGWNAFGYSQAFQSQMIQIARYTGVYGVSFFLVGASSLLVASLTLLWDREALLASARRQMAMTLGLGGLLVVAIVAAWADSRTRAADRMSHKEPLHIVGIQPNVPVEVSLDPEIHDLSFHRLVSLTEHELASDNQTDLVIWPESPLNLSLTRSLAVLQGVRPLVQQYRVYLLLNVIGETVPDRVHNSVAVIDPGGGVVSEYHKVRLFPFGEYVPLRGVIPFLDRIPALAGDFSPGHEYTLADIGQAQIGSFICSESVMPEIARRLTGRGATLLVEVTNDSWFGPTPAARQHLAHSIFRAVENSRDLIRVTNSGITVHVTPEGQLIGRTDLFREESRHWVVQAEEDNKLTIYTRYGDLFILLCACLCAVGFGVGLARNEMAHAKARRR